nr:hypothetical protein [Brachybacterium sillae]
MHLDVFEGAGAEAALHGMQPHTGRSRGAHEQIDELVGGVD